MSEREGRKSCAGSPSSLGGPSIDFHFQFEFRSHRANTHFAPHDDCSCKKPQRRAPSTRTYEIDFIPRAQSLLPPSMSPPSLLRARVSTRASSRSGLSNRVGLSFEGLELQPIELLGRRVDGLPPLSVDFTWPGSLLKELAALVPGLGDALGAGKTANDDAPGYFDVEYLDDELLIIRQQAPGGVFALVKVDSCDP